MLPEVDGIQICRTMRAERVDSAVLMLTARVPSRTAWRA